MGVRIAGTVTETPADAPKRPFQDYQTFMHPRGTGLALIMDSWGCRMRHPGEVSCFAATPSGGCEPRLSVSEYKIPRFPGDLDRVSSAHHCTIRKNSPQVRYTVDHHALPLRPRYGLRGPWLLERQQQQVCQFHQVPGCHCISFLRHVHPECGHGYQRSSRMGHQLRHEAQAGVGRVLVPLLWRRRQPSSNKHRWWWQPSSHHYQQRRRRRRSYPHRPYHYPAQLLRCRYEPYSYPCQRLL